MNIKEEMPNYYKILERMENSTHSILDYVIASAFDECTYDELERAAQDLARITAEAMRNRLDLARAIAWIDENVSFSEADKFAGTTLFETWQEVQAALKQSS